MSEIKISDKRECPHCHGSLERYEDPLAKKLLNQRDAELAELRKDKELLNWMDEKLTSVCGYKNGAKVFDSFLPISKTKRDIRATVDAAMTASQAGVKGGEK